MRFLRYLLPMVALVAFLSLASSASAQCYGGGIGNCWFGNLNAYGASGNLYGSGYLFTPPYFAVHPPVYYSHQYYRPYGWTPFAQPGYSSPLATARNVRSVVLNPYVPAPAKAEEKPADNTARSEMIMNPYFVQGQKTGEGRLASSDQR
ncbi:MAG TPA: hypothetical protein VL096_04300 [Pirellulaceae bacterium]|nr:hypothetical protein [Pirellulaceae bacterium]